MGFRRLSDQGKSYRELRGYCRFDRKARAVSPGKTVQIEVQNLDEMEAALAAHADIVMLDNFSIGEQSKR